MTYWLFNTDEAETPGQGAYLLMHQQSCIAAWGEQYNADVLLAEPLAGDRVFFYVNKVGIVAKAIFTTSGPFSSNSIFGKQKEGEFHREVIELVEPQRGPLSHAFVRQQTGYFLPVIGRALKSLDRVEAREAARNIEKLF